MSNLRTSLRSVRWALVSQKFAEQICGAQATFQSSTRTGRGVHLPRRRLEGFRRRSGFRDAGREIIEKSGKKYKLFYGMSSDTAMKKHAGGVAEYRASEGKTVEVPYKGPVEVTIRDVLGGVRSTCTYVGAGKLKELSRRTTFIRVTQQLNTVYGNDG